jgi:hypothetical protein
VDHAFHQTSIYYQILLIRICDTNHLYLKLSGNVLYVVKHCGPNCNRYNVGLMISYYAIESLTYRETVAFTKASRRISEITSVHNALSPTSGRGIFDSAGNSECIESSAWPSKVACCSLASRIEPSSLQGLTSNSKAAVLRKE